MSWQLDMGGVELRAMVRTAAGVPVGTCAHGWQLEEVTPHEVRLVFIVPSSIDSRADVLFFCRAKEAGCGVRLVVNGQSVCPSPGEADLLARAARLALFDMVAAALEDA